MKRKNRANYENRKGISGLGAKTSDPQLTKFYKTVGLSMQHIYLQGEETMIDVLLNFISIAWVSSPMQYSHHTNG